MCGPLPLYIHLPGSTHSLALLHSSEDLICHILGDDVESRYLRGKDRESASFEPGLSRNFCRADLSKTREYLQSNYLDIVYFEPGPSECTRHTVRRTKAGAKKQSGQLASILAHLNAIAAQMKVCQNLQSNYRDETSFQPGACRAD